MKTTMLSSLALAAFALATQLASPSQASAAYSAYVTGRLFYFEHNGGYCDETSPTFQNCDYTTYSYNDGYDANLSMQSVEVYLLDQNDVVIGAGSTDGGGRYIIRWASATRPTWLTVMAYADQVDDRFRIMSTEGKHWAFFDFTGKQASITSTTTQNMQSLGDTIWGSAASPSKVANVYGGAMRMWRSLNDSGLMLADFSDVEVRTFYDNMDPLDVGPNNQKCKSACAYTYGGQRYILLSDGHEWDQQARIMHELGHVASDVANPRRRGGDYCFPDKWDKATGGCKDTDGNGRTEASVHSSTSPEWYALGFEEGLADFLANRAIYASLASEPAYCSSNTACAASTMQIERSRSGVACQTNEERWEITTARYLRDIYDNSNDSATCAAGDASCQRGSTVFDDPVARPFNELLKNIWMFPAGLGNHDDEESLDANGNTDKWDGFSPRDYEYVYRYGVWSLYDMSPQDTSVMRLANCGAGEGDTH